MAGAIVAHQTLVGVAPKTRWIAVRAFAGATSKATGSGLNVLLGQALEAARSRGIVAIAAAGNGGLASKPAYPAAEEGVIAVTATDAGQPS